MHISVVMSVFNGEKYLKKAVDSILNQTYRDFIFIIINNASNDRTGLLLNEYAKKDNRIQVIHNSKTVTLFEARNQGIGLAKTEWVALMDADDISEPNRLEAQLKVISMHHDKIGAIGTWGHYINATGKILGQMVMQPTTFEKFEHIFSANEAITLIDPSAILHRPTFLAVNGYRPEYTPACDFDLYYRIAEYGRAILVMPEFLFRYRIHSNSESIRRTMLQRKKSHFINYNMRKRRAGLEEITWNQYLENVWSSPLYKFGKLYTDMTLSLHKHAGLYYGSGQYLRFLLNLGAAFLLNPRYVFNRLVHHKLPFIRRKIIGGP